jgi:hypothetical protein
MDQRRDRWRIRDGLPCRRNASRQLVRTPPGNLTRAYPVGRSAKTQDDPGHPAFSGPAEGRRGHRNRGSAVTGFGDPRVIGDGETDETSTVAMSCKMVVGGRGFQLGRRSHVGIGERASSEVAPTRTKDPRQSRVSSDGPAPPESVPKAPDRGLTPPARPEPTFWNRLSRAMVTGSRSASRGEDRRGLCSLSSFVAPG